MPLHHTLRHKQYAPSSVFTIALGTGAPRRPVCGVRGDFRGDFVVDGRVGDSSLTTSLGIMAMADFTTMLSIRPYCLRFSRNFQNSDRRPSVCRVFLWTWANRTRDSGRCLFPCGLSWFTKRSHNFINRISRGVQSVKSSKVYVSVVNERCTSSCLISNQSSLTSSSVSERFSCCLARRLLRLR